MCFLDILWCKAKRYQHKASQKVVNTLKVNTLNPTPHTPESPINQFWTFMHRNMLS